MRHRLLISLLLPAFLLLSCAKPSKELTQLPPTSPNPVAGIQAESLSLEAQQADLVAEMKDEPDDILPADAEIVEDPILPPVVEEKPLTKEETLALGSKTGITFDLDASETAEMEQYFLSYTRRARPTFERWLERAEPYLPRIKQYFAARGLPQDLAYLPFAESGFNSFAFSRAGACGMWQFMPYTGKKYGLKVDWWVDERRDPFLSMKSAADYLEFLHGTFGDWYLALAAYNAGEGRIARAMKKSGADNFFDLASNKKLLKLETRHYVPKFLAILKIIQNLESLGFQPLREDAGTCALPTVEILVKGGTDLSGLARDTSLTWDEFQRMNPSFRRMISPPGSTSTVQVPADKHEDALAFLSKPGARPYAGFLHHSVRSGESYWTISRRYSVPIAVIQKVNHKSSRILRPGEMMLIPGPGNFAADPPVERTRRIAAQRSNYLVKNGDTISGIARVTGVSQNTLLKANGLKSATDLQVGKRLYIPSSITDSRPVATRKSVAKANGSSRLVQYRVRQGDTLWKIAQKFSVDHRDLQDWNSLGTGGKIRPGDNLKVYLR